jgi:hypothetical protein
LTILSSFLTSSLNFLFFSKVEVLDFMSSCSINELLAKRLSF